MAEKVTNQDWLEQVQEEALEPPSLILFKLPSLDLFQFPPLFGVDAGIIYF